MSEAITVNCPSCKASLKLKNSNSVGKKVPCPKCKKPFVVKAPPAEDDEFAFMNASESDGALPKTEDDEDDESPEEQPEKSPSRAGGKRTKKGKSKSSGDTNWLKPLLIGIAALVVVGLFIGGGMVAVSMMGVEVKNKIDLTYLPHDADLVAHVRMDEFLSSPFMQPLMANATVKKQLDQFATEYGVAPGDVKTITMGVAGLSDVSLSKLAPPGMGLPGAARPGAGSGIEKTRAVVVVRTSKPLDAAKIGSLAGFAAAEHQGKKYYRPTAMNPGAPKPVVYLAAADVLLVADEGEIQRIIEKGPKQIRRAEFDFVETTPQILVVTLNKRGPASGTASAAGAPNSPPVSPGAPPGGTPETPGAAPAAVGNELASLSNGKVKAWYLGISGTQDIEIQAGFFSPDSLPEVQADLEKYVAKQKAEFETMKTTQLAMLPMLGLDDLIPQLEATVNSFRVSGAGSIAQVSGKIPGAIKASIEKGMTMMAGMMGGGPGGPGGPNPFGAQPPADGATDASTTSGDTSGTSNFGGSPQQ
jgi:hypothetical protein